MVISAEKGFTLLEVLIAVAMMSILLAIASFYLGGRGEKSQLKSAAADLAGTMNLARASAIRDARPWAVQFDPGGNRYVVYSNAGEAYAPEDPADPIDWTDGDETTFRSGSLPQGVSFGSNQGELNAVAIGDGVTYANDRIVFFPNGTCSGSGTLYLTVAGGSTFAVTTLSATGQVKIWSNYGAGWSN